MEEIKEKVKIVKMGQGNVNEKIKIVRRKAKRILEHTVKEYVSEGRKRDSWDQKCKVKNRK